MTASRLCTARWDNSLSSDNASAAGSALTFPIGMAIEVESIRTAVAEAHTVRRSERRTRVTLILRILGSRTDRGPAVDVLGKATN
ncbi:hypothetical protein NIIDNTM18_54220 [Mycolicibacterium litorale]|uniref:Uncharacterized protein n=1 Tax=Mycolicibacterium litorale TaxID=758802 RepID=A0A6S6PBM1_9MYCO|nr:hypothetical protein NIIDNTM18_54220 [Mycolicibacterium litorale]